MQPQHETLLHIAMTIGSILVIALIWSIVASMVHRYHERERMDKVKRPFWAIWSWWN